MRIRLRFYGVFRNAAGRSELILEVPDQNQTVRSVVARLFDSDGFANLRRLLLGSETSDPRPNALVMVSGREINTLQGLDTPLGENDELALLPVAHGG
jgi:molybdopterin converting factor small subunit